MAKLAVEVLDLGDDRGGTVDRVRAVVRVARVAGAPVHGDPEIGVAAGRDDGLQVGRFGRDAAEERSLPSGDVRADSVARLFLVDHRGQLDRTGQLALAESGERDQRGGQPTLHVGSSTTIDPAVPDLTAERIHRPPVAYRYD